MKNYSFIKRGDIVLADLSPTVGSEQGGKRPVVVISNDIGNRFSPTIIVAAITSHIEKAKLPTHVVIPKEEGFLTDSVVLLEQTRTLDKKRISSFLISLPEKYITEINLKLEVAVLNESGIDATNLSYRRGDIFIADLAKTVGSEQGGVRPVLVISNNVGNKFGPTVIVAALSSQISKAKLPTHHQWGTQEGLAKDSFVLLEQIRTIDKKRLRERITEHMPMDEVNKKLRISIGLY